MFGGELDFRVQTVRPSGAIHFTSLMSCVLSPSFPLSPLPRYLSPLPQMEVSGMGCVLFLQIAFIVRRGGGEGVGRLWCGCGAVEQISPELSAILENIIPSASPSCSPTAPFYGHLKTHKSTMIHQVHVYSTFWFI